MLIPNWTLLDHIVEFLEGGKGEKYRYPLFHYLLKRANARGRAWESEESLAKHFGTSSRSIRYVMEWLTERKAIYKVPSEHRFGAESKIDGRRAVWQITGVIVLDNQLVPSLHLDPDKFAEMSQEVLEIVPEDWFKLPEPEGQNGNGSSDNNGNSSSAKNNGNSSSANFGEYGNSSSGVTGTTVPIVEAGGEDIYSEINTDILHDTDKEIDSFSVHENIEDSNESQDSENPEDVITVEKSFGKISVDKSIAFGQKFINDYAKRYGVFQRANSTNRETIYADLYNLYNAWAVHIQSYGLTDDDVPFPYPTPNELFSELTANGEEESLNIQFDYDILTQDGLLLVKDADGSGMYRKVGSYNKKTGKATADKSMSKALYTATGMKRGGLSNRGAGRGLSTDDGDGEAPKKLRGFGQNGLNFNRSANPASKPSQAPKAPILPPAPPVAASPLEIELLAVLKNEGHSEKLVSIAPYNAWLTMPIRGIDHTINTPQMAYEAHGKEYIAFAKNIARNLSGSDGFIVSKEKFFNRLIELHRSFLVEVGATTPAKPPKQAETAYNPLAQFYNGGQKANGFNKTATN